MFEKLRQTFVKKIYADHNESKRVKAALRTVLDAIPPDGRGLNIGAGLTRFDQRIKNLELLPAPGIDYVGRVENIPSNDNEFDVVVTQEVLEHVEDPFKAISEIYRVLKRGGIVYIQLPFTIGFHPCPNDYWRFTREGISELVSRQGLKIIETGITVGTGTGFYRIAVEFFAILLSVGIPPMYKPFKALFSIILFPIKWLDPLLNLSKERDRIAGGYYVICKK